MSDTPKSELTIAQAMANERMAQNILRETIDRICVRGTPVTWTTGNGYEQRGEIRDALGLNVMVVNYSTGKTVRLGAYMLTAHYGGSVGKAS